MLRSGIYFYIGSSGDFRRRRADHQWRLRSGTHPCQELQRQFSTSGECDFLPLQFLKRHRNETEEQHRERLRAAEQEKLNGLFNLMGCQNKSPNASGPNNGQRLRELWKDPEYREARAKASRRNHTITDETRRKMADAKKGAKNPRAREVIVTKPDGSTETFPSTVAAARFFNVSQQIFEQWIKGITPWPGTGKYVRAKYDWIRDYKARFSCFKY